MGARSLTWLAANAPAFLPKQDGSLSEASLTALAEAALLVLQLSGLDDKRPEKTSVRQLAAEAENSFGEPKVLAFYRTGPAEAAIGLLVTWLVLRAYGAEQVLSKDALSAFVRERLIEEAQFTPMRKLELRWALDRIGIGHGLPSSRALLETGVLHDLAARNAAGLTEPEIYAFTHTVFFGTDYGRDLSLFAETGLLKTWRADALVLLEKMRNSGHWDLVAELVLVWYCLAGSENFATGRAWRDLSNAQRADGSFPVMNGTPIRDEIDPLRYHALRRYHVCLVTALAAFASSKKR